MGFGSPVIPADAGIHADYPKSRHGHRHVADKGTLSMGSRLRGNDEDAATQRPANSFK
jgi:hypothetical protein